MVSVASIRHRAVPEARTVPNTEASESDEACLRWNLLLIDLPASDAKHVLERSYRVRLDRMTTLMTPGSPINHVYFPETGALSELILMDDGSAVEIDVIGFEGMAGWPAVFGDQISATWVVCQTSGLFLQLPWTAFAEEVDRSPELHRRLHHHAASVVGQRAISAACDRHHDVVARCARHLLAARDLGLNDEMAVTHEFLALRLGVQRPTVTVALAELQRLGAIEHRRARVTVLNRSNLEQIACECYWAMRREVGRHLDWLPVSVRARFSGSSGPA